MKQNNNIPIYQQVMTEQSQSHDSRKKLYIDLEKELGLPVVSFFTSFRFPVMIEETDADMVEGLLQKIDLSKGLALLINSPGGLGLSAERIINICKSYSGTGEFSVIVPGKAKSAATMICMGANKIHMGKTSELGPIDPQISIQKDSEKGIPIALCNLVQSYKELFNDAINAKGNLEPYLQQLANYDARQIKEFEAAIALSEDVAIRALHKGMMKGMDKEDIKKKISIFLTPEETKSHGRSILYEEARKCGLKVELMNFNSHLWQLSYELFVRIYNVTNIKAAKCVENKDHGFAANIN